MYWKICTGVMCRKALKTRFSVMSSVPAINPIRITLPVALAIAAFYKRIGAAAMTGLLIHGPSNPAESALLIPKL